MLKDQVQQRIDQVHREPLAWLRTAGRQKRAADLVGSAFQGEAQAWLKLAAFDPGQDDPETRTGAFELGPTAMMLIGYAIEVLAKGIIVARGAGLDDIRRITRQHIDRSLLDEAAVALEGGEPFLVERLHHWVLWSGRYPAPNPRDGERYAVSASEGGLLSHPGAISTDDYRQACELYERMHDVLMSLIAEQKEPEPQPQFKHPHAHLLAGSPLLQNLKRR
jgi:hypothetical protein